MSEKRKISSRKIVQTLATIVLLAGCVVVMLSASKAQEQKKISGVRISIENEERCQFISKEEVNRSLFERRHMNPRKIAINNIDLKKMEHILSANPWIENAQVFLDNNSTLNIEVTQRVPQLRVFQKNGNSYYIDSSAHILPLSDHYTHYELLFINVPDLREDSIGNDLKRKMIAIANFIKRDTFWQAQTAEVVVNGFDNFEIVPVLGTHKILLGNADNIKEKLENVFAFYQNVLNKIGWDRYTVIDARFKNQVVAGPSLPWKAPVDRALSNMNWVKSIVGDKPKEEDIAAMTMLAPSNMQGDSLKTRQ
ncbi:MAG TPA: hypothetical protein VL092_03815 [Chitinophagaceae bacterium]|nr:hypothetical protein [Chitinophagaceae bacterium]